MDPTIANLTEQLEEARSVAAFWRDTATGPFAARAALPWEISPKPARLTRAARLSRALETVSRLYRTRKLFGRPVEWLFPRCQAISTAYLAAVEAGRQA